MQQRVTRADQPVEARLLQPDVGQEMLALLTREHGDLALDVIRLLRRKRILRMTTSSPNLSTAATKSLNSSSAPFRTQDSAKAVSSVLIFRCTDILPSYLVVSLQEQGHRFQFAFRD